MATEIQEWTEQKLNLNLKNRMVKPQPTHGSRERFGPLADPHFALQMQEQSQCGDLQFRARRHAEIVSAPIFIQGLGLFL